MNTESVTLIVSKLEALAVSLGVTVEQLFPYFIKQVYVNVATTWLCLIIAPIFIIVAIKLRKNNINEDVFAQGEPKNIYGVFSYILLVFGGFLLFLSIISVLCNGFNFLNPEYHALKDMLNLMKLVAQ